MEQGDVSQIATPLDLYERPTNTFVSDFVGKTNLLKGKITAKNKVTVNGTKLKVGTGPHEVGSGVQISIRPEKFHMSNDNSGHEVRIDAAIFLGASWLYSVSGDMGELFVTQPNTGAAGYSRGDIAWLDWQEDALTLFEGAAE